MAVIFSIMEISALVACIVFYLMTMLLCTNAALCRRIWRKEL